MSAAGRTACGVENAEPACVGHLLVTRTCVAVWRARTWLTLQRAWPDAARPRRPGALPAGPGGAAEGEAGGGRAQRRRQPRAEGAAAPPRPLRRARAAAAPGPGAPARRRAVERAARAQERLHKKLDALTPPRACAQKPSPGARRPRARARPCAARCWAASFCAGGRMR